MAIGGYSINDFWWLFRCKPLVVIDGYVINDYCIISFCWVLYVML